MNCESRIMCVLHSSSTLFTFAYTVRYTRLRLLWSFLETAMPVNRGAGSAFPFIQVIAVERALTYLRESICRNKIQTHLCRPCERNTYVFKRNTSNREELSLKHFLIYPFLPFRAISALFRFIRDILDISNMSRWHCSSLHIFLKCYVCQKYIENNISFFSNSITYKLKCIFCIRVHLAFEIKLEYCYTIYIKLLSASMRQLYIAELRHISDRLKKIYCLYLF